MSRVTLQRFSSAFAGKRRNQEATQVLSSR